MMTRREFLRTSATVASAATATLLLTPLGCTSSDDGAGTSTTPTLPGCTGVGAASTVDVGHVHELCVPEGDLAAPPANGATYATTPASTDQHTHTVTLTEADLTAIQAGQTVTVTTSTTEGHTHRFSITRAVASTAPPPTGGFY